MQHTRDHKLLVLGRHRYFVRAFRNLGRARVTLLNNSFPFGTDGALATIDFLEARGIRIVAQQTSDVAATDREFLAATSKRS